MNSWRFIIAGLFLVIALQLAGCGNNAPSAMIPRPQITPPSSSGLPLQIGSSPSQTRRSKTSLSVQMVTFLNNQQYMEAIGAANRVIKNGGPSVPRAYSVRGTAEGQLGEFGLAVQDLRKATELNPKDNDSWLSLAWYEYENGSLDSAIKTGEKAVALAPRAAICWLNLGLCYAVKNDVASAKRAYDHGRVLAQRGIIPEAVRDIDNARERYPKSTKSLNQAMKWLTGES